MIIVKGEDSFTSKIDSTNLQLAAQTTLEYQDKFTEADLSIVITDNSQIQAMNLQFRGIDSPTDVLSFPADFIDPDTEKTYLGDVVISYPKCHAQAQSADHSVDQELTLLVIHGVLHLIGYDHDQIEEKKRMWSVQSEILERLGYNGIRLDD